MDPSLPFRNPPPPPFTERTPNAFQDIPGANTYQQESVQEIQINFNLFMEGENSNGSGGSKRKYADIGQRYATKQIKQRVDRSVDCILSCLQTLRPDQRLVFCARLLQDDRLFSFFEPVIGNPDEVIVMKSMIRNLKDGLQEVKSANSKDKLAAKHSLLSMIVGKKGDINKTVSSKLLKIQPRNLSKAAARRKIMSLSGANVWALAGRMPRSNRIDDSIKRQVHEFWLDNTKVSPKVRDVMKRRTQAIQYLDISQVCSCN